MNNLFCEKCTLQFDKEYVFDLHLSLVHGEKIGVKKEDKKVALDEFVTGNPYMWKDFGFQKNLDQT